jgi:hypothetical protein
MLSLNLSISLLISSRMDSTQAISSVSRTGGSCGGGSGLGEVSRWGERGKRMGRCDLNGGEGVEVARDIRFGEVGGLSVMAPTSK